MKENSKNTVITLANAVEVATGVVHEVLGDQVASTLNGNKATRQGIADLVGARIHANLAKHTSKVTQ